LIFDEYTLFSLNTNYALEDRGLQMQYIQVFYQI